MGNNKSKSSFKIIESSQAKLTAGEDQIELEIFNEVSAPVTSTRKRPTSYIDDVDIEPSSKLQCMLPVQDTNPPILNRTEISHSQVMQETEQEHIELDLFDENSDKSRYSMYTNPRGFAVIIANEKFKKSQDSRPGTKQDVELLEKQFADMNFKVEVVHNLKGVEIDECCEKYAKSQENRGYSCFVLFILSHGGYGHVSGIDGKLVAIPDIINMFNDENSPNLTGKPKLFFINACQVGQTPVMPPETIGTLESDAKTGSGFVNCLLPESEDMLLVYSCLPGTLSFRNPQKGSVFIINLVQVIQDKKATQHLEEILCIVRHSVKEITGSQCPASASSLKKKFYFK